MSVTVVLWISVALQLFAVFLALRLIPLTGRTLAWIILSAAFFLMATRRAISLLYQQGLIQSEMLAVLGTEAVALAISILIATGVYLIRNVFLRSKQDHDSVRKLNQIVEQNANSTIVTDTEGRIEYVNQKFAESTGYSLDEIRGQTTAFLNAGQTSPRVYRELWDTISQDRVWTGELCNRSRNGNLRWERARIAPVKDENNVTTHFVAVLEDVTEHKAQREALEHMAMHDALTDLPNRALFYDRVYQAILNAENQSQSAAVLLMDLNHFKVINDTLGHFVGDKILKGVAERLRNAVSSVDTVARMGGDEFLVLLTSVNESQAMNVAERLIGIINEPFSVEGHHFDINASVGLAMYPEHGDDPDILIQRADVAMYAAKASADNLVVYHRDYDKYSLGRLELLGDLRSALDGDQFVLHYQPRINLGDGSVVGVEALVRWNHPARGLVYPDQFIPVVEETGHIQILTRLIIRKGLQQLAEWHRLAPDFVMSINISTNDLSDAEFARYVARCLQEFSIDAKHLVLEITESALMKSSRNTQQVLDDLEGLGVLLAIDDFGTGYSSLQYLKELPVAELKIDRSFVMNMLADENDAVIVRSTVDLAHNLGLEIVAEGVEDEEVSKILQILDCDFAQGYYYSRPVPAEHINAFITQGDCTTMSVVKRGNPV